MEEQKTKMFSSLGELFIATVILILAILLKSLMIFKFYHWFIMPVFTELPIISFANSIGLSFFISLFTRTNLNKNEKSIYERFVINACNYLFLLLIGYLFCLIIY